jgi:hypothetical protein
VVAKKALEQRDKDGNFTEFQGLTLEERGHKIREAKSIITSIDETQNKQVKEVQRINMNTATDMVMSTHFEVNGQKVVMSKDQKDFQLDQMYQQKIPGTNERIITHEDYIRLKNFVKPPKPEKERVSLVPFTHQTDGDTVYINKYDAEEVAQKQSEGYKPGSVIKKEPVTKESKADKLIKALGGEVGAKPQQGTGKTPDKWIYQNGKLVKQ